MKRSAGCRTSSRVWRFNARAKIFLKRWTRCYKSSGKTSTSTRRLWGIRSLTSRSSLPAPRTNLKWQTWTESEQYIRKAWSRGTRPRKRSNRRSKRKSRYDWKTKPWANRIRLNSYSASLRWQLESFYSYSSSRPTTAVLPRTICEKAPRSLK